MEEQKKLTQSRKGAKVKRNRDSREDRTNHMLFTEETGSHPEDSGTTTSGREE